MPGDTVYQPLEKIDQCAVCQTTERLRLCSSCGERTYCSTECQKQDWPSHKPVCGKNSRLDLGMFYPFLAALSDANSVDPARPPHPAILHKVINSPNPGEPETVFPDGKTAKLVILGDPLDDPTKIMSNSWWPTARDANVRSKLQRRIMREGWVLPKVAAVCMSLLTMYSTTWVSADRSPDGKLKRRVRLNYRKFPIADFGIAKGEVFAPPEDQLAYYYTHDNSFSFGQNPKDHYWIYFQTAHGGEVFLDCNQFTFNFCMIVPSDMYLVNNLHGARYAPAHYVHKILTRDAPPLHTTKARFSVLRDTSLHDDLETNNFQKLFTFMEKVAGRKLTNLEKEFTERWTSMNRDAMDVVLETEKWKSWPDVDHLQVAIEKDPDEDLTATEKDKRRVKEMRKMNRQLNKGEITHDQWEAAYKVWKTKLEK